MSREVASRGSWPASTWSIEPASRTLRVKVPTVSSEEAKAISP